MLALTGFFYRMKSNHSGVCSDGGCPDISNSRPYLIRVAPFWPCHGHNASHGLCNEIKSGSFPIGTGVAKSGNACINDLGVDFTESFVSQTEAVHYSRAEVFYHNMGGLCQFPDDLDPFGVFQVYGHTFLVPADREKKPPGLVLGIVACKGPDISCIVSFTRLLDLYYLCPIIPEHHGSKRPGQH